MSAKPARRKTLSSPLMFDFNKVARKALRDHPELKKDILIIDVSNDHVIATAATLHALEADDDACEELDKTIRLARKLKSSFAQLIMIDNKKTIQAIVFHPDRHLLFDPHDRAIDCIGTLDHELAHLLAPDADRTHGENIADAYAVLRHLQRFPERNTDIGYASWKRVMTFIMTGHTSHLTTFTIDRILLDRSAADFISLPPAQTIALARQYARKHTRSSSALSRLQADFSVARNKRPTRQMFHHIARVTLAADVQSDTFYLGVRALLPALNSKSMELNGKTITLRGAEWRHLREQLEGKIATLPRRHPLQVSCV